MTFRFKTPIYDVPVVVHHTSDKDSIAEKYGVTFDDSDIGACISSEYEIVLVFFEDKPGLSVLAHEVFHATSRILRMRGVMLDDSSEEAYAYLHGFLFDKVGSKLIWTH